MPHPQSLVAAGGPPCHTAASELSHVPTTHTQLLGCPLATLLALLLNHGQHYQPWLLLLLLLGLCLLLEAQRQAVAAAAAALLGAACLAHAVAAAAPHRHPLLLQTYNRHQSATQSPLLLK